MNGRTAKMLKRHKAIFHGGKQPSSRQIRRIWRSMSHRARGDLRRYCAEIDKGVRDAIKEHKDKSASQ